MAEQTTPIGKPISAFEELTEIQGTEIIPVVDGKNKKVSAETLKTFAQKGVVKEVNGKGLSSNDYTNEAKQKLGALPTNEKLTQDIAASKFALFIDQWNAACGSYGKYDPTNAPDAQHPFYLNELWLTYEEAMNVYQFGVTHYPNPGTVGPSCRTNIMKGNPLALAPSFWLTSLYSIANRASNLEVLRLCGESQIIQVSNIVGAFYGCSKLRKVIGQLRVRDITSVESINWLLAPLLEELYLYNVRISLPLQQAPKLNYASFAYLVANAANTTPITITVHPNVYAKLADETNTEWHKVMTDGAAKNISFATTE